MRTEGTRWNAAGYYRVAATAITNYRKGDNGNAALHLAAQNGNKKKVAKLIKSRAKIDAVDGNQHTPLHLAVEYGHTDVVKLLLKAEADVNLANRYGWTALRRAVLNGHGEIVELLLKAEADVNLANRYGWTALRRAVNGGHAKIAEILLQKGALFTAEIDAKDGNGNTLLHQAVESRNVEMVKVLINNLNASTTIENDAGRTPLQLAVIKGYNEIVKILVDKCANINVIGKGNNTLLHLAVQEGHAEIAQTLIEKEADTTIENDAGYIHIAAALNTQEEILKGLTGYDAREAFLIKNNDGDTPLHLALKKDNLPATEKIVNGIREWRRSFADDRENANAACNIKDSENRTPLDLVVAKILETVQTQGAQSDDRQSDNRLGKFTALVRLAETLIESSATINAENKNSKGRPISLEAVDEILATVKSDKNLANSSSTQKFERLFKS